MAGMTCSRAIFAVLRMPQLIFFGTDYQPLLILSKVHLEMAM